MGTEARIALILAAAACLVTVLVDWVVEELTTEEVVEELLIETVEVPSPSGVAAV